VSSHACCRRYMGLKGPTWSAHQVSRKWAVHHGRLGLTRGQVYPLAHTAANTAPGDMGSRVRRTPIALWMALAIAAIGGTRGTSPAPRTPKGWPGLGTSTITVSIIGRSTLVGMR